MKIKKILSSVLLALLISALVFSVVAAAYWGNSSITLTSTQVKGSGNTTSTTAGTNYISVQCWLVVPGVGNAATGALITKNSTGTVTTNIAVSRQAHKGEQMKTTCLHRVIVNNVLQGAWYTNSDPILIP